MYVHATPSPGEESGRFAAGRAESTDITFFPPPHRAYEEAAAHYIQTGEEKEHVSIRSFILLRLLSHRDT